MKIEEIQVVKFRTDDGQDFVSKEEAEKHVVNSFLYEMFDCRASYGDVSVDAAVEAVVSNAPRVIELLNSLADQVEETKGCVQFDLGVCDPVKLRGLQDRVKELEARLEAKYAPFVGHVDMFLGPKFEGRISGKEAALLVNAANRATIQAVTGQVQQKERLPVSDTGQVDVRELVERLGEQGCVQLDPGYLAKLHGEQDHAKEMTIEAEEVCRAEGELARLSLLEQAVLEFRTKAKNAGVEIVSRTMFRNWVFKYLSEKGVSCVAGRPRSSLSFVSPLNSIIDRVTYALPAKTNRVGGEVWVRGVALERPEYWRKQSGEEIRSNYKIAEEVFQ